jgi:hypothetical protein
MRKTIVMLVLLGAAGCSDDSCPGIGSGRNMLVTVTAQRLSGDCGTPTDDEIVTGLVTQDAACLRGAAHEPSADLCEQTIVIACEADYGAFRWNGDVSYAGGDVYDGVVAFTRFDPDAFVLCEGTYLVTYRNAP